MVAASTTVCLLRLLRLLLFNLRKRKKPRGEKSAPGRKAGDYSVSTRPVSICLIKLTRELELSKQGQAKRGEPAESR